MVDYTTHSKANAPVVDLYRIRLGCERNRGLANVPYLRGLFRYVRANRTLFAGNGDGEEFHRIRISSVGGFVNPIGMPLFQTAVRTLAPEAIGGTEATVPEFDEDASDSLRCLKCRLVSEHRRPPTLISVPGATASTTLFNNSSVIAIG